MTYLLKQGQKKDIANLEEVEQLIRKKVDLEATIDAYKKTAHTSSSSKHDRTSSKPLKDKPKSAVTCSYCSKDGHHKSECRRRERDRAQAKLANLTTSLAPSSEPKATCSYCGKTGHSKPECFKLERDKKEKAKENEKGRASSKPPSQAK
jgi:hypothetical protein